MIDGRGISPDDVARIDFARRLLNSSAVLADWVTYFLTRIVEGNCPLDPAHRNEIDALRKIFPLV